MQNRDLGYLRAALGIGAAIVAFALPKVALAQNGDAGAGFATCCIVVLVIIVVVNLAMVVWLLNDASARGASPGAWIVVFLLFGPLALLAYLVVRPRGKLVPCPECGRQKPIVDPICPHCGRRVV